MGNLLLCEAPIGGVFDRKTGTDSVEFDQNLSKKSNVPGPVWPGGGGDGRSWI